MKPYFEDSVAGITLWHGRCEEVLPGLERVDHVVTDPPYSEYVHSKSRRGSSEYRDAEDFPSCISRARDFGFDALTPELMRDCSREFARLASRWVLVFSDVESSHRWRRRLTGFGLEYVRTGAWHKLGATPQFTGDRPASAFEAITICHPRGRKRWNGGGSHALWSVPIVLNRGGEDPRLHTAQKPLALMTRLVELFTNPGDAVLDPFAGSGTTLLACKRLGRRAVGVEMDEAYCETIARRLQDEPAPLFVTEAPVPALLALALEEVTCPAPEPRR